MQISSNSNLDNLHSTRIGGGVVKKIRDFFHFLACFFDGSPERDSFSFRKYQIQNLSFFVTTKSMGQVVSLRVILSISFRGIRGIDIEPMPTDAPCRNGTRFKINIMEYCR